MTDALWADRSFLLGSQYKTDTNLAARQSIYAYQRPHHDIARLVLDLAGLDGTETVADVGCGNGVYLAELTRRTHTGRILGLDLSPGMLTATRTRLPAAASSCAVGVVRAVGLVRADAAAIPLPDGSCDVALAPHMLYHLPEPAAGARELRRITRPGGRALVVLNGQDHLRELRDLVADARPGPGWPVTSSHERLSLEQGEQLLSTYFSSVTRHDFPAWLEVPDPAPIIDYIRSMHITQHTPTPDPPLTPTPDSLPGPGPAPESLSEPPPASESWPGPASAPEPLSEPPPASESLPGPVPESLLTAVAQRITATPTGTFRIRTHSGCLICT